MIALVLLACAPTVDTDPDPCTALQGALEACGYPSPTYECAPGDGADTGLLACMASAVECPPPGTSDDYTDATGPAYVACSGAS